MDCGQWGRRPMPDLSYGNYPANYPGRIPLELQTLSGSLYDLRKLSVLFYCGDLTSVRVNYSSAGKRDCYLSQPKSMTSEAIGFKDLHSL